MASGRIDAEERHHLAPFGAVRPRPGAEAAVGYDVRDLMGNGSPQKALAVTYEQFKVVADQKSLPLQHAGLSGEGPLEVESHLNPRHPNPKGGRANLEKLDRQGVGLLDGWAY